MVKGHVEIVRTYLKQTETKVGYISFAKEHENWKFEL